MIGCYINVNIKINSKQKEEVWQNIYGLFDVTQERLLGLRGWVKKDMVLWVLRKNFHIMRGQRIGF